MKKLAIVLAVALGITALAVAGVVFHSATTYEANGNYWSWTNRAAAAVQITAIDMDFGTTVTCTVDVYRVRSGYTNLLQRYTMTANQYLYANGDEFSGVRFIENDILVVDDNAPATVTNNLIPNLEVVL